MFCPKCAAENPDEARFCRQCGVEVQAVQKPTHPAPQAAAKRWAPLVFSVALSACGLLLLFAGLAAGDVGGIVLAAPFLIGAYWLYPKK